MVNWSKAPEGATHWGPDCDCYLEAWYRLIGDDESFIRVGGSNDWQKLSEPMKSVRRLQLVSLAEPIPGSTNAPTLETMLTEWRDLEARAQAAQAEADALFEHAGQCHGEIVVRLAELGWGAPRGPMVPGEPVVTLDEPEAFVALSEDWWKHVKVGDYLDYHVGDGKYHIRRNFTVGKSYRVHSLDMGDTSFPWELYCDDGETYYWGSPDYFTPSTQP